MDDTAIKAEFHEAMLGVYRNAKDIGYNASRFLRMLSESEGVDVAKKLIPSMSDGFAKLWKLGRLDLSVEAVIVNTPKFHRLFSQNEIDMCRKRLADCGYDLPPAK